MALDPEQLARLQRAYEILGLPQTASAPQIKQAYRKLTKRWHPDLYTAGSREQAEATQMMKVINESYDAVASAPLRYYKPEAAPSREREAYVERPRPVVIFQRDRTEPPRKLHLFEFCVRFVCGAIFGLFVGFRIIVQYSDITPSGAALVFGGGVVVCGLLAGFLGDDFWLGAFRRTWWWW